MKHGIRALMMISAFFVSMMVNVGLGDGRSQVGDKGIDSSGDRTLAPFFFVQSDDPDTDRLPLKSTHSDINIAGMIADVTITQVYRNEGKNTIEAIYIFPASTLAAVHAMRMTIGERVIQADIMERQKARKTYEQAKRQGQTASLLEQQRPNVFQMNVVNILPGDEIKVELRYTELIEPEDRVYEFVLPAVVGPRYSNTPAAGAPDTEKWVENPYLHSGEAAPYSFGLSLNVRSGIPITHLTSPSHDVSVEYSGKTKAHVVVKDDKRAGTKDFVLRYKLAGGQIHTGVLLYPGQDENFFLLMMEPPERVKTEAVVPREYIFVVDVSGSMNGFPIKVAKGLMKDIVNALGPNDLMNVLLFAGGSAVLSEGQSLPATTANKSKAIAWIHSQHGGDGTNILPALKRALDLPRTEGISRIVVVVTDGYVHVEPQAFELIRKNLGQANLFAFGIGSSVNRYIIEGMARVGQGEPFVVLNQSQAHKEAVRFRRYIESPVLTDINVTFKGLPVNDVEPLAVPDLFALRPVMVFGKYKGAPAGELVISGKTPSGDFRKAIPINSAKVSAKNAALRLLWARHRIMRLSDLNRLRKDDGRVKEVTALGLRYSLMTQYTSFVAVDKVKRADGEIVTIKQPLPLPEGVSDLAVGGRRYSAMKSAAPMPVPAGRALESVQMDLAKPSTEASARQAKGRIIGKGGMALSVEEVRGDLHRALIERTLQSKLKALTSCCLNAQHRLPPMHAEGIYRLMINTDGTVKEVRVVTSTLSDDSLIDCLKKIIAGIKFPRPERGTVEVILKVVCRPMR